jgi:hypothetical protein
MKRDEQWGQADREQALKETRQKLEVIEREWKSWREQSRTLTVELVTVHGVSVARASQLSGHHRNTITAWLNIHNAEMKARNQ